MAQSPSNLN